MIVMSNTLKIAFTGKRPGKYSDYNLGTMRNRQIVSDLETYLLRLNKQVPIEEVYTGGALGFDTHAFMAVAKVNKKLRTTIDGKSYHQIITNLCIPFENQSMKWRDRDKEIYNQMKRFSDVVHYVDTIPAYSDKNTKVGVYSGYKMQKRNEFMIDNCNLLIAFWDYEESGGTWNAIKYAKSKGIEVKIIDARRYLNMSR